MKAVKSGQLDVVRSLLQKYADMDAQDEVRFFNRFFVFLWLIVLFLQEGRTVLHLAIDKGYSDILALLLEYRPSTEIRTKVRH